MSAEGLVTLAMSMRDDDALELLAWLDARRGDRPYGAAALARGLLYAIGAAMVRDDLDHAAAAARAARDQAL